MCGRFNVIDSPGLKELLKDLGLDLSLPSRVNVAPTERVALIREVDGARTLDLARWWLTPSWAKQVNQKYAMFNARSEGLTKSAAYRTPFRQQRGIVPMSSFVEWRGTAASKQPWMIRGEDSEFAAAALWDVWEGEGTALLSCTIVTAAAPEAFGPWHKRMPVMLEPQEWDRWLDNAQPIAKDDTLFDSRLKQPWRLRPLGREIGNAREKHLSLLEPVGEEVLLGSV
ncbi:MAG: SOS response-associated peptidase [Pseudomonadota bacterium]